MRRFVCSILALLVALGAMGFPAPKAAFAIEPVTLTMTYSAYLSAVQAAGLTYGAKTYSDLMASGVTDREALGLEALIRSGVRNQTVNAALVVTPAMAMAQRAYLQSQGLWEGFKASCAGAYAYGSYAWVKLSAALTAFWGVQAASVGVTPIVYPSVTSGLGTTPYAYSGAGNYFASASNPNNYWGAGVTAAQAEKIVSWILAADTDTHGSPIGITFTTAGQPDTIGGKRAIDVINCMIDGASAGYHWGVYNATQAANIAALYTAGMAVAFTGGVAIAGTTTKPAPYVPGTGDMPEDPFPGDPWETPPQQPTPLPIPLWKINDPSTNFGMPPTGGQTAPPTVEDPAPYVPPAGTDTTPIPPAGVPLLGDPADKAADALDTAVPDSLGWLKAPFVAILRWMADLLNWLQSCWNTVCGWVAGWVVPSDAGLAAAWSAPYADLTAAASTRIPFCMPAAITTLWTTATSGTAAHSLPSTSFDWNILGIHMSGNFEDALPSMDNNRWVGDALAWVWLIVALIVSFRPRVVT